jgi:hypothetical protein
MKLVICAIVLTGISFGQSDKLTTADDSKFQVLIGILERQERQLTLQSQQLDRLQNEIRELKEQNISTRSKATTILLKTLTVIDHTGSVASIYSVVPHK